MALASAARANRAVRAAAMADRGTMPLSWAGLIVCAVLAPGAIRTQSLIGTGQMLYPGGQ